MSDCSATDVATISEEVLLSHVLFGHSSLMPLVEAAEGSRYEVATAAARCRCYHRPLDGECPRKACLHSNLRSEAPDTLVKDVKTSPGKPLDVILLQPMNEVVLAHYELRCYYALCENLHN